MYYYYVCTCNVWMTVHATTHTWRSKDDVCMIMCVTTHTWRSKDDSVAWAFSSYLHENCGA